MQDASLSILIYEFFWKWNWAKSNTTHNINELVLHTRSVKRNENTKVLVNIEKWNTKEEDIWYKMQEKTDTTGQSQHSSSWS